MKELGMSYSKDMTKFSVLAPTVDSVELIIYKGYQNLGREIYTMEKDADGIYRTELKGDLKGKYYTYLVNGKDELTDPYSYAVSLNGIRSSIVDLSETNPEGWEDHKIPSHENPCASIIYEVHVKDFTVHNTSGAAYKGKYLGFAEEGTDYNGIATGIDHLKELGVTHVQIMPVNDFLTVRENKEYFYDESNYNWGYDPEHYNAPEGSYSLKPEEPGKRIKELKTMIMNLHEAGIGVILDVVYNHTFRTEKSNFNVLYPDYYYRKLKNDKFSDGSCCGNELATENKMVAKFIKDSLVYWMEEYKVDGFRFDLMALMDIDTSLDIVEHLKEIKEDVLLYGEPWTGGDTVLSDTMTTTKGKQANKGFAFFNDDFRDSIKGDNSGYKKGFSQGNIKGKIGVERGIAGSIYYDDAHIGFAACPCETVNYVNSHDNLILQDKLVKLYPNSTKGELIKQNKFIMSILLSSQGISFIHAGNEFMRSKNMDANSYRSPLSVNAIDWSLKEKNKDLYLYMKDLIELKKTYPEFSICDADQIRNRIKFFDTKLDENLIAYTIERQENKEYFLVIHNGNLNDKLILSSNMKNHIKYHYSINPIDIKLDKVLGIDGFVKGEVKRLSPHGIMTEKLSTAIWNIKIMEAI